MVGLEIKPHFGRPAEIPFESQGCIHGKGTLTLHYLVDASRWDTNVLGNSVFRKPKRYQEVLAENLAGMNGSVCFHGGSVGIDDFDIVRAIRLPAEADAPLVVDADGVLAFAVAFVGFQSVAWRDGEVVEFGDCVKLSEFPQGNTLDGRRERSCLPFLEEGGGLPRCKGADHQVRGMITWRVNASRCEFMSSNGYEVGAGLVSFSGESTARRVLGSGATRKNSPPSS